MNASRWIHRVLPGTFSRCVLVALLVGSVLPVRAATVTVPDDFATIQAVIDSIEHAAGSPAIDTILVRPHVSPETVHLENHNLTIIGLRDSTGTGPTLLGMDVIEGTYFFRDLHFNGPVRTWSFSAFRDCEIDSGVTSLPNPDSQSLRFVQCILRGQPALSAIWQVEVDSCQVFGPIVVDWPSDAFLGLRYSTVTGPGNEGVRANTSNGCEIIGNIIRGFVNGVSVATDDGMSIVRDNLIENCIGVGIAIPEGVSGRGEIAGNVVIGCRVGIECDGGHMVIVGDNFVLNTIEDGMRLRRMDEATVERNVVGRSTGHGILVESGYHTSPMRLRNNTVYASSGSGFAIHDLNLNSGLTYLENNISHHNDGFGLSSTGDRDPVLGCNDWFANGSGAVDGTTASATDLAVDPRFCDMGLEDVRLFDDSPMIDVSGCGQIGARGVGCKTTATLVTLFTAQREADGVIVRWQFADGASFSETWLERARAAAGPWARVAAQAAREGEYSVLLDRDAAPDREQWYRLHARRDGAVFTSADVRVGTSAARTFALDDVTPNPGADVIRVHFTLARDAAIDVDVFDVMGRHVVTLTRGSRAAGSHVVEWPGRSGAGLAAAGLYLVRYRYPGGQQVRHVLRVH